MIDRAVQRELIELITSLLQLFQQIDWRDAEQTSIVMDILQDIDDNCRRGLSPVRYEQYSDMLATLEQTIRDTEWDSLGSVETNECRELCREIVDYVLQLVRDEKEIKKEIVFLPYKASMWDSLESVWQAAAEDKEHCNAYVMPIPYADRNPDGSAAQWHCERDEFPTYVPTVDFRKVNLEEWHPDIIFIHNPYDDRNIVTSVDPAYYSHILKECTDKLIYIPYFVIEELELDCDDPEKEKEVMEKEEKIARFATTPGVLNADYTILQSEATRELYLKALERNTNKTREYWEKRILGIGSPKFDKVVASKREDYVLPKEWRKLLDGRKSILYNTSIGAMLTFSDNYLAKLRSVLETFKSQNDIVLWWRPHPLLRATFQSMHPELLDEYDEIVKSYCREGWGIYDDTTDLDRAIIWTDGYYGDWSSVVHLYEKTSKPIMVQYIEEPAADDEQCNELSRSEAEEQEDGSKRWEFAIFDFIDYKGYYWFSAGDYNALFRMDKKTKKIEYLGSFPNEDILAERLYTTVTEWRGKLYFAPCTACEIGVYDTENNKFEKISIGITFEENDISNIKYQKKFVSSFINLNTLILMPCCYDRIIYCNLVTGEISEDVDSCEYFRKTYEKKTSSTDKSYYFCWFAFRINDNEIAFHLHNNANKVIFFNLLERTFREETVGDEKNTYLCSAFDGDNIWLYNPNGDSIVSWNRKNGKSTELCMKETIADLELHGLSYSFINMNILKDKIYLIPASSNMVVEVNVKNKEITRSALLSEECSGDANIPFTHMCKQEGDSLFLCGINRKEFIEYSMKGEKKKIHLIVPEKYREEIHEKLVLARMKKWERIWWEPGITVSDYINVFDKIDCEKNGYFGNAGKDIFETVIQ